MQKLELSTIQICLKYKDNFSQVEYIKKIVINIIPTFLENLVEWKGGNVLTSVISMSFWSLGLDKTIDCTYGIPTCL